MANEHHTSLYFHDTRMTSINELELPTSIKDVLMAGQLCYRMVSYNLPPQNKSCGLTYQCFIHLGAASLDTVEDLLLYTPPSVAHDAPSTRFKRHQPMKGSSVSNGYDRLMNLTSDEVTLVYNKAAEYIAETRVAYGSALDLLQEQKWLTLGDPVLDAALGGSGIMTHAITEIAGER